MHSAGFIHCDVKEGNVLLRAAEGGRLHAVLADFGCVQCVDAPQKTTRPGTATYRDPRVRGTPDYGAEVDIYSFGKMLFNLRQKVTDQQLSELCISLHAACIDIDLQRRPDAVQVAAHLLPYVQASQGAMGNVRPTTNLNQLVLVGDAVRANHSRAGDTGSELRAVRAPPPAPRQIEWDTSDVPDDVDRDNVVYVSRSKYHHRKCEVVHTWHHRAYGGKGTTMQKSRFEDIARRVSIKPCSKCAAPAPIAHRRPCRPCRHPRGCQPPAYRAARRPLPADALTASASSSTCSQGAGCARLLFTDRRLTHATTRARAPHGWSRLESQMATRGSQASWGPFSRSSRSRRAPIDK